ncbi:hypothetical protein LSH36_1043g00007 [Paralvinella palmiformis]|uniref:Uncharacterized protein n=1 Tax=Paralvinella palmiformis TaxID=53620 RepID=A0AAD9MS31_9ANNE|nr:hypothetical protein LSH36_1043g00007 [Paralvinella palmiformis]
MDICQYPVCGKRIPIPEYLAAWILPGSAVQLEYSNPFRVREFCSTTYPECCRNLCVYAVYTGSPGIVVAFANHDRRTLAAARTRELRKLRRKTVVGKLPIRDPDVGRTKRSPEANPLLAGVADDWSEGVIQIGPRKKSSPDGCQPGSPPGVAAMRVAQRRVRLMSSENRTRSWPGIFGGEQPLR